MKISVIITCYAEGEEILAAIQSIESQKFENYELIIVNDKSNDETTNKVCSELTDKGYKVIWRQHNGGLSAARNTGISNSNYEIIVPLDGDDILPENSLFLIQEVFKNNNTDFIFGDYKRYMGRESKIISSSILCNEDGYLNEYALAKNWILLGTSPFKKSMWKKINGYDEDKHITNSVQDIDFFMRAINIGMKGKYVPQVIYQWNDSFGSMNKNVKAEAYKELELKNQEFLLNYKFKTKADLKNYLVTMLFGNKFYEDLFNYIRVEGLRNLHLKNIVKYYIALLLAKKKHERN